MEETFLTGGVPEKLPGEFSLWDSPWIPVKLMSDETAYVGFRDALVRAHEISHIAFSNPLADTVVTRFLIALTARIHEAPTHSGNLDVWDAWANELLELGHIDAALADAYGSTWADRFFLFHPQYPFLQDPSLVEECGKTSKLNKLFLDTPSGNNPLFWDNGEKYLDTEERTVDPAAAAEALVVQSQYASGGRCTARSGVADAKAAPLRPASVYMWRSSSLFKSLLLNAVPSRGDDDLASRDRCAWEHAPHELQSNGFFGRLTDTNRGLLLVGDASGVSDFYLTSGATGWTPPTLWDAMVAVRHPGPKPKKDAVETPLRLTEQASAWADTSALVSATLLTKLASVPSSLGRHIVPPPIFVSRGGGHRLLADVLRGASATVTTHHADKSKDIAWSHVDLGALNSFLGPSMRPQRRTLRRFCSQVELMVSNYRYALRIAFGEPPAEAKKLAASDAVQPYVVEGWTHAYRSFLSVVAGGEPQHSLAEVAEHLLATFDQVTSKRTASDLRLAVLTLKGRSYLLRELKPFCSNDLKLLAGQKQ